MDLYYLSTFGWLFFFFLLGMYLPSVIGHRLTIKKVEAYLEGREL